MAVLANLVGFTTTTTGTGTITVGSALQGLRTLAGASIADGTVVSYGIKTGATGSEQYETGTGTVGGTGTTLTRSLSASSTGSLLSLSGTSEVYITDLAADHSTGTPASTDVVQTFTAAQRGTMPTVTAVSNVLTLNLAASNFARFAPSASFTLANPTNVPTSGSAQTYELRIVQPAGGACAISFGTNWVSSTGAAQTHTTTANSTTILSFTVDSVSGKCVYTLGPALTL